MKILLAVLATVFATATVACAADDDEGSDKKSSPIGAENASTGNSSTCPAVMQPPASACENGTWVEKKNQAGCTTSFECVACPAVAAPPPGFCPDGNVVVETKNAAGCVTGFECVACPQVAAPPASACEDGTWVEKKNAAGCVTGFDCVK